MSQYTFTTREYGPNAKGTTLTWEDLDYSLLFLSESINETLSGTNYKFVTANGTPTENAFSLSSSYVEAKATSPTSASRFALLTPPGSYKFDTNFILDTEYIDIVSITGERDIFITGSGTISVAANDIYLKGIDVGTKNFNIAGLNLYVDSWPKLKVKNCKGGDYSFGGIPTPASGSPVSPGITVGGTFVDCEGGNYSFAGNGQAYGTFINCIGGNGSFGTYCDGTFTNCIAGNYSFAFPNDIEGGTFIDCTAGHHSFASIGTIDTNAILRNCAGGVDSFASGVNPILGLLYGCRNNDPNGVGNFTQSLLNIQNSGSIISCINANNTEVNS
jgi:hypothetical protein